MNVKFTPIAEKRLLEIYNFIKNKFGENIAKQFSFKIKNFVDIISNYPNIGTIEDMKLNIRGFQLTKQTKIIYRIKQDNIIILNLFDTRQNPQNKKY